MGISTNAFMLMAVIAPLALAAPHRQSISTPEDPKLRATAVGLLEHADQLSSPVWPMNEQVYTFHIPNPEPGAPTDGSLKLGVGAPGLIRWEQLYGSYQLSQVQNGSEVATFTTGLEPAAVVLVRKMVPVNRLHFDDSDIIRAVSDKTLDGVLATCIDFDTITGSRHINGSLCVDKSAGYLIYQRIDDVIIKQSKFFKFNNGYLPGHLERWTGDTLVAQIDAQIQVKTEFDAHYFDYPASAKIKHLCNSFTPVFAENTPQPAAKSLSEKSTDIVVHGFVDEQGHPSGLQILDDTHHELAAEAMNIVSAWTFRAAQCDYKPTTERRDFIVHFQGWQ